MAEPDQKVQRLITTRRFLDKRRDPWEYVDEELPTTTIKLRNPGRRVETRAPLGTIPGSYRVTGTHYDFGPGTYSLRITRLDVGVAGTQGFRGTLYRWHLRHSREGTLDVLTFGAPSRVFAQGDRLRPIYSVGPGTLVWGWLGDHLGGGGTHVTYTQSLEAIPG